MWNCWKLLPIPDKVREKLDHMARGSREDEGGDGTYRPSAADMAGERADAALEDDLEDDSAGPKKAKKHGKSSRASASPRPKKAARRTKHEEDEAWKPTDEDIEDEELEVEEMVNDDLGPPERKQSPAATTPRKKAQRPKKTPQRTKTDDTYMPSDEELEEEELEMQESINEGLLGDDLQESKPKPKPKKKKSPRRKQSRVDDSWDPAAEELAELDDEDDEEDEDDEYVESEDEESRPSKPSTTKTSNGKPKTPRISKQRPSPSPAPTSPTAPKVASKPKWQLTSASNERPPDSLVQGQNSKAPFTFAAYRGEGACMLAMNWKNGTPPNDFVGFAIEYREPQSSEWRYIPNYLTFPGDAPREGPDAYSSRYAPHQRFRWVHFPFSVETPGKFIYKVTPVFMKGGEGDHALTYGEEQQVAIELMAETYPGKMNIAFTRGFVSSKAFLKKFGADGVKDLLPLKADDGLDFKPKNAEMEEKALTWMGFEARELIYSALDAAIADSTAEVRMLAYDFNEPEIVRRLQKLGKRVKIIIDDSGSHAKPEDAESKAADMLRKTAGQNNVQRQHMGGLQHNKVLVVDGKKTAIAIGGSTNFSWRGLYVQNNNLVAMQGAQPVKVFREAFDNYWDHPNDTDGFYKTASSQWMDLGLGIDAKVTFSPHSSSGGTLEGIAADIKACESSLFYSLAFLYETPGVIRDAIEKKMGQKGVMVYGLSDKSVGGLDARKNGNPPVAYPEELEDESAGGSGARMHHKFVVIDFDKPTARVYTGSHNFSTAADTKNAENLFLIRDRRVATAYMIQAVAMFDHYEVRDHVAKKKTAEKKGEKHTVHLRLPPSKKTEKPWFDQYWSVKQKINDREMFGV
ncbi:hypothetical protein BJ166DRAFT_361652 [Pestalotiopsis sp. NC0098]|nr:hypothetical protein BJ166DRAFT_361652 [Pestalotiopsis sp. NC0098]